MTAKNSGVKARVMETFDLYSFPKGHSGPRKYVSVRGHVRSIPVVYTYRGTDGFNRLLPKYGGDYSGFANYSTAVQAPMIMRDIGEYVSPIDGVTVSSRSTHRSHMQQHGVIEVGNERVTSSSAYTPIPTGKEIYGALQQAKNMSDGDYAHRINEFQRQGVL